MYRRIGLALVVFLLAASPAAPSIPSPGVTIEILVDGRPLPQYPFHNARYVEALKNREYAIRLRNPYGVRVAVALSVDGLNTIDARHTTAADARKWVIEPYGEITISGWQTSMTHARRFEFTTEEQSYGQWLGRTDDLGIISAVFFRERVPAPVPVTAMPQAGKAAPSPRNEASAAERAGQARADRAAEAGDLKAQSAAGEREYAATGIGRETDHAVRQIHLDLESTPAASVNIRYEYRAQLVHLGILPPLPAEADPLARRENARGFRSGFCPEPKK